MKKRGFFAQQYLPLLIIGAVALITVLVNLLTPIGNNIRTLRTSTPVTVSDPAFLPSVEHLLNAPISQGKSIEMLNNGDAFMTAMLADIQHAKQTIDISNYIWEDGAMLDRLFDVLIEKQHEGVPVRILVDANGGKKISKDKVRMLEDAGGKIVRFRPGIPGKLTIYHMRLHRRAIVIDGSIAYTGGIGFADRWLGDARNENEWRDVMVRITGNAASGIQSTFAELWTATSGEVLVGDAFYPIKSENASGIQIINFNSSPIEDIGLLSKFYTAAILSASHFILITTPYFIPDKSIREALIQKARDGVDIELILPNNLTDTKSVRFAGQSFYTELLDAGVKIYEYQPTFIHSKYMVVDGTWSIIGSANMDNRSLYLNEENVVGVLDSNFGSVVTDRFMEDRAQSREITRGEWKKRNLFIRIAQGTCRLLSQQF